MSSQHDSAAAERRCLSDETLVRFASGQLAGEDVLAVEEHLDWCSDCRAVVGAAKRAEVVHEPREDVRPESVEGVDTRYLPIELIGSGGMGAVFRAYDPRLQREVALKVVSFAQVDPVHRKAATDRLLREAQALAQLSHPNIVSVYDVGTRGDDVFVAMELIRGQTVREWLAGAPTVDGIIATFVAAGQGLAAVHDAGLVHRDCKPENMMVASSGEVKILDFGLARLLETDRPGVNESRGTGETTTRDGSILGTPRYMAPEQRSGGEVDARADQYSFCVALYEAIFGERPPATPSAIPARPALTKSQRCALMRGLSEQPEARFPNIGALCDALRPPRSTRRDRLALLAVAAIAVIGVTFGVLSAGDESPCERDGEQFAGIWDEESRSRLALAFSGAGVAGSAELFGRTAEQIDKYTGEWGQRHQRICRATHERGSQSAALLDLRMRCLEKRRRALERWLEDLGAATDREPFLKAVSTAHSLTALDVCEQADLSRGPPPPTGADDRATLEEVERQLAEEVALTRLGRYREALEIGREAATEATELGYEPLVAEALLELGRTQSFAGDPAQAAESLFAAAERSIRGARPDVTAEVWVELIQVLGELSRHREAAILERVATSSLGNEEWAERLQVHIDINIGWSLREIGKPEEARERYQRAIAALDARGTSSPILARALYELGATSRELGEYSVARDQYRRSRSVYRTSLGATHPAQGKPMTGLGELLMVEGKHAEAVKLFDQVEALYRRALEEHHPAIAIPIARRGAAYLELGELGPAERELALAAEVWERRFGPEHVRLGWVYLDLGRVALAGDRTDAAIERFDRAATVLSRRTGLDSGDFATALSLLGLAHARAGHHRPALKASDRALSVGHPEPVEHARIMLQHARTQAVLGDTDAARGMAERALEVTPAEFSADRRAISEFLRALPLAR